MGVVKESPYSQKERKDTMNRLTFTPLEVKLIRLKIKYDKLARREPCSGQQVLDRMIWERLRNILIIRYGRYE